MFTSHTASAKSAYTVKKGDCLSTIARSHNVSLDNLLKANPDINDKDFIAAGQTINLPGEDHQSEDQSAKPAEKQSEPAIKNLSAKPEPKGKSETFTVTAYTSGNESTGKNPGDSGYGVTASGAHVQEGTTIACPKSIPFGTKVYIPALDHTYICQDRGGAIKEGRLDIYMNDLKAAQAFGKKKLDVVIEK
ncbi:LysM peptidoglycan-binding domain-containing protein [Scopulibacillus daqui]|uniref:LysM peptidoglycan-binding domain-containing protein n=1 Tax=Scopulibacillus daqui TaxID=1469162 RepID=UPI0030846BCB